LLPQTIAQLLGTLFVCVSTLLLIAFVTPWFVAALVPISTFGGGPCVRTGALRD